jgi:hypothetical protein
VRADRLPHFQVHVPASNSRSAFGDWWFGLSDLSVPALAYHLFFPYIAVASALGEIPLELWLIVKGVNAQRWKVQASAAVG